MLRSSTPMVRIHALTKGLVSATVLAKLEAMTAPAPMRKANGSFFLDASQMPNTNKKRNASSET